jgi:hemolysin III
MSTASYSHQEELANSISHGLGALLSLAALVLLLIKAYHSHDLLRLFSYSLYGVSLVLLFSASTLYHASRHNIRKKLFKLLDHCAIYVLIAGTYTPLMLLTMKDQLGMTMFIIIWLIAFVGILFKIKFGHRFKKLSLITYIGMGTISLLIIHRLQQALTSNAMILLALGGLVYLLGVYFYIQKKIPYNHAIWHLFVLAGASLHFFMIWLYV